MLSFSFALFLAPVFANWKLVDREYLWFAMKGELEPIGQKAAKHGHLLGTSGPDFAGRHGKDVVVVGLDP